jgi:hypothetical protein
MDKVQKYNSFSNKVSQRTFQAALVFSLQMFYIYFVFVRIFDITELTLQNRVFTKFLQICGLYFKVSTLLAHLVQYS